MKNTKNSFFEFLFTPNLNNCDNIEKVYCDSKTPINYIMQVFYILFSIIFYYLIYNDFIKTNLLYMNFGNLVLIFFMFFLATSPTLYYAIKIINFSFYIDNEKVEYRNIIGRTFTYPFKEIKSAKYYSRIHIGTSGRHSYITVMFKNKKTITISYTDKNFEQLKAFLLSKNMLIR